MLFRSDMKCKDKKKDISIIEERAERIKEIIKNKEPFNKSHLKLDGSDIIALGFSRGAIIGEILDYLLDRVLEHPEYNNREKLIEIIKDNPKFRGKNR